MSLFSTLSVFTSGTSLNITVDIARTFTTAEAVNAIRCGYVNAGGAKTYFAVFKITNARFVCTITSAIAQTMNVEMYIGSVAITSNSVPITAVTPGYELLVHFNVLQYNNTIWRQYCWICYWYDCLANSKQPIPCTCFWCGMPQ